MALEVRRQLTARPVSRPRRTNLAGLIGAAGRWHESGATFRTSSAAVARAVVRRRRSELGLDRLGRKKIAVANQR